MTLNRSGLFRSLVGCLSVGTVLATWEIISRSQIVESVLLPAPGSVFCSLYQAYAKGSLIPDMVASLRRVGIGFTCGAVLGGAVGIFYLLRWPRLLLSPILELIRPIPPLAWIPLSLLWFGFGDPPAYFLVGLGAFFPALSGTHLGLARAEVAYERAACVLGLNRFQIFLHVTLPQALPSVLNGLRVGLGVSWMIVVTAELVGAQSGLGYLIQISRAQLQTDLVIGAMFVIGVIGFALTKIMSVVEHILLPWRFRGRELGLE